MGLVIDRVDLTHRDVLTHLQVVPHEVLKDDADRSAEIIDVVFAEIDTI